MFHDGITEEIRQTRQRLAERFDNDIDRIGEDLRRREAVSDRRAVRLPKRQPRTMATTNKVAPPRGSSDGQPVDSQTAAIG